MRTEVYTKRKYYFGIIALIVLPYSLLLSPTSWLTPEQWPLLRSWKKERSLQRCHSWSPLMPGPETCKEGVLEVHLLQWWMTCQHTNQRTTADDPDCSFPLPRYSTQWDPGARHEAEPEEESSLVRCFYQTYCPWLNRPLETRGDCQDGLHAFPRDYPSSPTSPRSKLGNLSSCGTADTRLI